MTDDVLRSLATWLQPAAVQLSTESLDLLRQAITNLAGSDVDQDVVLAAHGEISDGERLRLENALEEADPTFARGGKDELLARVAAAVLAVSLSADSAVSVRVGLLVQSAHFVGLSCKVEEVVARANYVVDQAGRQARERSPFKASNRKPLVAGTDPNEVITYGNVTARRIEDLVAAFDRRTRLMDEEIDTLWWARSTSTAGGESWEALDPVTRIYTAAFELSEILTAYPPTQGAYSLLREVGGQPGGTESLSNIGLLGASTALTGAKNKGALFPITTSAKLSAEYPGESKTISTLLKSEGCDPKASIALNDLGAQLMREISLEDLS